MATHLDGFIEKNSLVPDQTHEFILQQTLCSHFKCFYIFAICNFGIAENVCDATADVTRNQLHSVWGVLHRLLEIVVFVCLLLLLLELLQIQFD